VTATTSVIQENVTRKQILPHIVLHLNCLSCAILPYPTLLHSTLFHSTLFHSTPSSSTLPYPIQLCCTVLYCTVLFSTLSYTTLLTIACMPMVLLFRPFAPCCFWACVGFVKCNISNLISSRTWVSVSCSNRVFSACAFTNRSMSH
jgi:hypothetical protein